MVEHSESMIEARPQNRRRAPRILGCTEDNDSIRWMDFLERGGMHNLNGGDRQERYDRHQSQNQQTKPPAWLKMLVGGRLGHS